MPDMLTPQVLAIGQAHILHSENRTDAIAGPLVLETLFKHFLNPSQASRGIKHKEAREDDLMYDEGTFSPHPLVV